MKTLIACFDTAGLAPFQLKGRSGIAHDANVRVLGAVGAMPPTRDGGTDPLAMFEITASAQEAKRVLSKTRHIPTASAVGPVWYKRKPEWTPEGDAAITSCLRELP